MILTPALVLATLATPGPNDAWEDVEFYGDLRLRAESTFDQPITPGQKSDRHRGRLRARFGARWQLAEDLKADVRLASFSGDANNPHWDFGGGADGFSGSDVVFDRVYLTWDTCERLSLRAGKQPHVFSSNPVYGELVWDGDVHPAGVTGVYRCEGDVDLDLRVAGYVAVENSKASDPSMVGAQLNLGTDVGDSAHLGLSSSLSGWGSLNVAGGVPGNQGNTMPFEDFLVWDSVVSGSCDAGSRGRATVALELVQNLDDKSGEDTGWSAGAKLGRSGSEGDWNVFATAFGLDANSLFSPVAQDDTPFSGTGSNAVMGGQQGVITGVQYWAHENVALKLWALTSDGNDTDDPVRVRFDIDVRIR